MSQHSESHCMISGYGEKSAQAPLRYEGSSHPEDPACITRPMHVLKGFHSAMVSLCSRPFAVVLSPLLSALAHTLHLFVNSNQLRGNSCSSFHTITTADLNKFLLALCNCLGRTIGL